MSNVPQNRTPDQLSHGELVALVAEIRDGLFPREEPDRQWSPDNLDWIAQSLEARGLVRVRKGQQ